MIRSTLVRSATAALLMVAFVLPATNLAQDRSARPAIGPDDLVPTPAQAEGPFYPTEVPPDHDDDLTSVDGMGTVALGTPLALAGRLLDADGRPVEGATVEIWQTDSNGIYLHPDDPGVAGRDGAFQGYGESVTDADGAWSFSTILPDVYGGRPRHIHAKVRIAGAEVLTTQIYFADIGVPLEGAVQLTGTELDGLIVELEPVTAPDGTEGFEAHHLLVLP